MTRFVGTEVTSERLHDQVCGYRKSPVRGYMTRFVFSVLLIGYMTFFGNVQTQRLHDQICGYRKSQLRGYMTSFLDTEVTAQRLHGQFFLYRKVAAQRLHNQFWGYRKVTTQRLHNQFWGYRKVTTQRLHLTGLWVQKVTTKRLHDHFEGGTEKSLLRGYMARFVGPENRH